MTDSLAPNPEHILDHTRSLWEELRGEHIFLTGGNLVRQPAYKAEVIQ